MFVKIVMQTSNVYVIVAIVCFSRQELSTKCFSSMPASTECSSHQRGIGGKKVTLRDSSNKPTQGPNISHHVLASL